MKYEEFIQSILNTRGRFACGEEYHERHHILPKCMGGSNDEDNLIDLYAREHYEAHRLLAQENRKDLGLIQAFWLMSHAGEKSNKYKITDKEYEEARLLFSQSIRGESHPLYGTHRTEEVKERLRKAHTGTRASLETRKIMSEKHKGENNYWAKPVICDNQKFGHIGECAEHYRVSRNSMNNWLIGRNNMPQKFIDLNLHCAEDEVYNYNVQESLARGKNPRARKVVCENVVFDCVKDCADYYGVVFTTMFNWLCRYKSMPNKFIEMGLRFEGENVIYTPQRFGHKSVICDGVIYRTIAECAKFYNMKENCLSRWLSGNRPMRDDFKKMGLAYYLGGDADAIEN